MRHFTNFKTDKFLKMSDELDALEQMSSEEKKKPSGKTDDSVQVKLTGADADALRAFRQGKPLEKKGKALTSSNGARLKKLIARKVAEEFHGVATAPCTFKLSCDSVPELRDDDGKLVRPAKPSAECRITIKPDSYVSHHGMDKDTFDRISEITHDPLLEEDEPQFVDKHFTKVISPVIAFNSIPPVLRKQALDAITRLKNLSVEVATDEGTKVITMPDDCIKIVPKWHANSTLHDAKRNELDRATNDRFEDEGIKTSMLIV